MYPDKVNSLVLVGSSCGGKDHTPKPPEFIKLQSAGSLGSGWIRLHPESSWTIQTGVVLVMSLPN
jgi:hypothetical protein